MLSIIRISVIMLSVIMLSVIMLCVIMLSVIMLSVMMIFMSLTLFLAPTTAPIIKLVSNKHFMAYSKIK